MTTSDFPYMYPRIQLGRNPKPKPSKPKSKGPKKKKRTKKRYK